MLLQYDRKATLSVDVDASKAGRFGAMIHHVEGHLPEAKEHPDRMKSRPILFLNCLLRDAETRYCPTELGLTGVVWVLVKVRHMADVAPRTITYRDRTAAPGLAKQKTLTTSSIDKMNL